MMGMPFVAIGISTHTTVEGISALFYAVSLTLFAIYQFAYVRPVVKRGVSKILFTVSALCVIAGMIMASVYGVGKISGNPFISIPTMAMTHGLLNSLGFTLFGLFALLLEVPKNREEIPLIPFSRISAHGKVNCDFFEKSGFIGSTSINPTGLVDKMSEFDREGFDSLRLPVQVRQFYENTQNYFLTLTPKWSFGFKMAGRIYARMSRSLGQMCLPIEEEGKDQKVDSRIFPLDAQKDGRLNVRAWVRNYSGSNTPVYVAAYSTHKNHNQTYMNIAFPLPFGNLTSILKLNMNNNYLILSSVKHLLEESDQGVYFVNRVLPVRLPMNETIRVWTEHDKLLATHDMWLWGYKFLSLDYEMHQM